MEDERSIPKGWSQLGGSGGPRAAWPTAARLLHGEIPHAQNTGLTTLPGLRFLFFDL
jgi:hypothetical protein